MKRLFSILVVAFLPSVVSAQLLTVSPDHNFICPTVKVATNNVKFVRFYVQNLTAKTKALSALDLSCVPSYNESGILSYTRFVDEKTGQPFTPIVLKSGDRIWYDGYANVKPATMAVQLTFSMSVEGIDSLDGQPFTTEPVVLLTDSIEAVTTTGITPNNGLKNQIVLYPNPAKSFFNLVTDFPNTSLKLSDVAGRTVLEQHFVGLNNTKIDVSTLKPGVYFVQILKGEEVFTQKLLIK